MQIRSAIQQGVGGASAAVWLQEGGERWSGTFADHHRDRGSAENRPAILWQMDGLYR
jgi:hypothetical protein